MAKRLHVLSAILAVVLATITAVQAQTATPAQNGSDVIVRGTLSRGGKAGNLWTLRLDQPFEVDDPREPNPVKKVTLQTLRFTTRAGASQYEEFEVLHD